MKEKHYQEPKMNLVPMVVEQSARGERAYDIYSRLLKERVNFYCWSCRRPYGKFSSCTDSIFGI